MPKKKRQFNPYSRNVVKDEDIEDLSDEDSDEDIEDEGIFQNAKKYEQSPEDLRMKSDEIEDEVDEDENEYDKFFKDEVDGIQVPEDPSAQRVRRKKRALLGGLLGAGSIAGFAAIAKRHLDKHKKANKAKKKNRDSIYTHVKKMMI